MTKSLCALRVDDLGLEAWQIAGRNCDRLASFAADDSDAFAHWLGRQPRDQRYRLLVDLADEGMQVDTLPRTRGADRRALIARRFAAHFAGSPITWLHSLGGSTDAPHLERVALHGLARPTALEPWLAVLQRTRVRLDAVCSAALLLGHFAPRALHRRGRLLFVSFGRTGMRLNSTDDDAPHFTRLVPGVSPATGDWLHELGRTRSYLATQHGGAHIGPIHTIVLTSASDAAMNGMTARPGADSPDHDLEIVAAATMMPAGGPPPGSGVDAIDAALLQWLARAPRNLHCRTQLAMRTAEPARPNRIAYGAAAAAFAGGLVIAALRWADAAALDQESAMLEDRTAALRRELAQLDASRPPLPATPAALLAALEQLDHERASRAGARPVFEIVAAALDATAGVELDHLSWQRTRGTGVSTPIAVELRLRLDDAHERPSVHARLDHLSAQLELKGARALERDDARHAARPPFAEGDAASAARVRLRFEFDDNLQP